MNLGREARLTIRDFHYLGSALLIWLVMLTTLVTDFHDIEVSGKKHISYMIALGVLLSSTFIYSLKLTPRVVVQSLAHSRVVLLFCFSILLSQGISFMILGKISLKAFIMGIGYLLVIFCGYIIFPLVLQRRLMRQFFLSLAVIGVVSTIIGLFSSLTESKTLFGLTLGNAEYMDALGIYSTQAFYRQRTAYGAQVFLGAIGSAYFVKQGKRRGLATVSLGLCLLGVFISWGRSVWVATLLSFFLWFYIGTNRVRKFLLTMCMIMVATATFILIATSPLWRSVAIMERGLSGREVLWPLAIVVISEAPITGHGLGQASEARDAFGEDVLTGSMLKNKPSGFHNFFLDTAVTAGLPVAILSILVIAASCFRLWHSRSDPHLKTIILTGLLGMLTIAFFTTYNIGGLRTPSFSLTVLLGLANRAPWLSQSQHTLASTKFRFRSQTNNVR